MIYTVQNVGWFRPTEETLFTRAIVAGHGAAADNCVCGNETRVAERMSS